MTLTHSSQHNQISNNSPELSNSQDWSDLQELRIKRSSPTPNIRDAYGDLKRSILKRLNKTVHETIYSLPVGEARILLQEQFDSILAEKNIVLTRVERRKLFEDIVAEELGLGPLEPFINTQDVTQILVNGPQQIYIERFGQLELAGVAFEDDAHLLRTIRRILAPLGKKINSETPIVNARLADGSYVNVVMPPIALNGPTISIQRASHVPFTMNKLIELHSITEDAATFLRACVQARLNILIAGNVDSGRTTLLNALCHFFADEERIITVEDTAELRINKPHLVRLEAQETPASISKQSLIENALRMRPDRLIVGEVQGAETSIWLQALHVGQANSLSTVFANSTRDALNRLEMMAQMGGTTVPQHIIRAQVSDAIDLIIHLERLRDGSRKTMSISEVLGVEGDLITTNEIFRFEQSGTEQGVENGRLQPTGLRPKFMWKMRAAGINVPPSLFGIGLQRSQR